MFLEVEENRRRGTGPAKTACSLLSPTAEGLDDRPREKVPKYFWERRGAAAAGPRPAEDLERATRSIPIKRFSERVAYVGILERLVGRWLHISLSDSPFSRRFLGFDGIKSPSTPRITRLRTQSHCFARAKFGRAGENARLRHLATFQNSVNFGCGALGWASNFRKNAGAPRARTGCSLSSGLRRLATFLHPAGVEWKCQTPG